METVSLLLFFFFCKTTYKTKIYFHCGGIQKKLCFHFVREHKKITHVQRKCVFIVQFGEKKKIHEGMEVHFYCASAQRKRKPLFFLSEGIKDI